MKRVDKKINTVAFVIGRHRLTDPQERALRALCDEGGEVTFDKWIRRNDLWRAMRGSSLDALWSRGLVQPKNLGTKRATKWTITPKGRLALDAI